MAQGPRKVNGHGASAPYPFPVGSLGGRLGAGPRPERLRATGPPRTPSTAPDSETQSLEPRETREIRETRETRQEAPPLAPGLVAEATHAGQWLFRWRSYLPLAILVYVLVLAALHPVPTGGEEAAAVWSLAGIAVGLLGFAFRGWTVGRVPMGTSGRGTEFFIAETLNTEGSYSAVRHPLYFGNYLMWIGAAAVAGNVTALVVVTLAFWIYYERIMMAEERFLYESFGEGFGAWAARTPAFLPKLGGWKRSPHRFSLRYALGRDYSALYGLVASTTAVEVTRNVAAGRGWLPGPAWQWYFGVGTAVYLILLLLKRNTRLLEVSDR